MRLIIACGFAVLLTACGGSDEASRAVEPPPEVTGSATHTPTPKPTRADNFPKGYPKVVRVASLPDQMRWSYKDYSRAVMLAPGVWTPLPPGASVKDAVGSGVLDGYCGSIKAYEREYTNGQQHAGTCW